MKYKYKNLMERREKIAKAEGQGLVMLHDDFDPDWVKGTEPHGILTFGEPAPKTDEQLQEEARDTRIQELLNKSSTSSSETQQLIALLARKQGFTVPTSKDVSRR